MINMNHLKMSNPSVISTVLCLRCTLDFVFVVILVNRQSWLLLYSNVKRPFHVLWSSNVDCFSCSVGAEGLSKSGTIKAYSFVQFI